MFNNSDRFGIRAVSPSSEPDTRLTCRVSTEEQVLVASVRLHSRFTVVLSGWAFGSDKFTTTPELSRVCRSWKRELYVADFRSPVILDDALVFDVVPFI